MSKEAMKLALEALETVVVDVKTTPTAYEAQRQAITALREALAEQPEQQEPVAMWDGKYQIEFGNLSAYKHGEHSWIPLYTSPPAQRKPLTDEQILRLVPGLQDCLCDPYDYNNSGDDYASIPKDMIRLARAIEAAHGITGETK
jgi:hypothetical protein